MAVLAAAKEREKRKAARLAAMLNQDVIKAKLADMKPFQLAGEGNLVVPVPPQKTGRIDQLRPGKRVSAFDPAYKL